MKVSRFLRWLPVFLVLLGAQKALAAAPFTQFGPCGCFWDNSTKNYPQNSVTEGLFSTTVRYQCGYLCKDKEGRTHHLLADHEVSYRGKEIGNEVVCEGLAYPAHDNPTGEGGRWVNYFWDGITRAFDARQSASPTLQHWSQTACQGSPLLQSSNRGMTSSEIDQFRSEVQLPAFARNKPQEKVSAKKLDPKMKDLCQLTPRQQLFIEGQSDSDLCSAQKVSSMKSRLEQIRLRHLIVRDADESLQSLEETTALLLCPYASSIPSLASLKTLGDKLAKPLSDHRPDLLQEFACTLGLRGMSWSLLPKALKDSFEE
ncbi:MAG: hypothetical protein KF789_05295 [Bdellovibrionaceae bacterium]|nr:hypothetical protein [Pseudobdellovibrionaceae bacterium]